MAEGKVAESAQSEEVSHRRTLMIVWDVRSERLISTLIMDEDGGNSEKEEWEMQYDLRSLQHSVKPMQPPPRNRTLLRRPRSDVSVDCSPYYRSPLTQEDTNELLMHKSVHVVTLRTPDRLCTFDVTIPFRQLITMEQRELRNETDLASDYLLPLVSARLTKKEDTFESRRVAGKKMQTKKTALSRMRMIKMLGANDGDSEGKDGGQEGKEVAQQEGKESSDGRGKGSKQSKSTKRKGKKKKEQESKLLRRKK